MNRKEYYIIYSKLIGGVFAVIFFAIVLKVWTRYHWASLSKLFMFLVCWTAIMVVISCEYLILVHKIKQKNRNK